MTYIYISFWAPFLDLYSRIALTVVIAALFAHDYHVITMLLPSCNMKCYERLMPKSHITFVDLFFIYSLLFGLMP